MALPNYLFTGLQTKTLKRYTSYDKTYKSRRLRIARNRRKFDYDYEYWEKNFDSNNNIKLITRKYDAHDLIFNTVNAIYGKLRENNNRTTFNKTTVDNNHNNTELTLTSANPTSESKLTAMSSISEINTDLTVTSASVRLFKPDLTTLVNDLTSFSAPDALEGSITSKIEPKTTTITPISKETPTIDESISKFSIKSTDSSNTGETTRDWREIIDFTVIPEDTVADLLFLYANTTTHVPGTTLKPPPFVNPTEFLFTTKKFFDLTVTTIVTKNPILVEIEEEIQKTNDGFFTSSLIVLLKTLVGKNESDVGSLLHGVDIAIVSMSKDESLSMFNATVLEVFQSAIQMLLVEPSDVRNDHLRFAIYALENRRTFLLPDTNALFTVVDTVYIADDVIKIADFIREEVAGFPNNTKDPSSIARQAIELFIILPHLKVKGTAKEELLMMGLNMVIKSRMFPGQMDRRRAGDETIKRRINSRLAAPHNKREMNMFKGYKKLNTNPYLDIKKLRNFRRIHLDYDYEDWDKTKPDVYDDLLTKTKVFSTATTESSIFATPDTMPTSFETGIEITTDYIESLPTTIEDTIPTTNKDTTTNIPTSIESTSTTVVDNITNTSTSVNYTHITLPTTQQVDISEAGTTLDTKPFDTGPNPSDVTTPILPDITTPVTPEITTSSPLSPSTSITTSVQETTTLSTTSSTMTSEVTTVPPETIGAEITAPASPFVADIKSVKDKLNCGYFTASLAVVLREIADKDAEHLQPLMTGFHGQVMSMITNNEFAFLGYPAVRMIASMIDYMSRQYPETVQAVAKEGVYLVENRRSQLLSDINTIMDVADTIYVEEDARNIANVLDHLKSYPGTDKSPEDITREGLDALIFFPWSRILGDPRERLLRLEIEAAIKQRAPAGRRHNGKMNTNRVQYNLRENNLSSSNEMSTNAASADSSTVSETTHEYQYLKNATIVKRYYGKVRKLKKVQYRKYNDNDNKSSCDEKSRVTKGTQCSNDERNDFDKTIDSNSDSYYSETDSSYEESNINNSEQNSFETLTRREKNGDTYKSNENSKVEDYESDSSRNFKKNKKRLNVKTYKSNSKIIEQYVSTKGFESHKKGYDKYPQRHYLKKEKNSDRIYKKDLKGIVPKYKPNKYGYDTFNYNRNNYLSRIKISTRPTQIKYPISAKNYKSWTEYNFNTYNRNENKNNGKNKQLNVKRHDKSKINNKFYKPSAIRNYHLKLISSNDKYNKKYITMKEYRSKVFNKLGKSNFKEKIYQMDRTNSDSIDDERLLKANIEDAIVHRENVKEIMDGRRNLEVKVNKFQVSDSGSDDEVNLKGKIYKVFGYSDNFGKKLRTMH